MLDENVATTSLPSVLVKISSNASMTSISGPVKPLRSTFVLSEKSASTPWAPSSAKRCRSKCCAVDRRLVDLEVAGEEHHADRAGDGHGDAVRHAVRDADELERQRADRDGLARAHGREPGAGIDAVLFELRFDERQRHGGAVDRAVEERHHVRDGADVVLVAVREDERLDLVAPRLEIGEVRDDQVHAELVGVREHDAGVDEDGRVLP